MINRYIISRFTKSIFLEFGTSNVKISLQDSNEIIIEPNIIAANKDFSEVLCGKNALEEDRKNNQNYINPVKLGKIAEYRSSEIILKYLFKKISKKNNIFSNIFGTTVICSVHNHINEVELSALEDAIKASNVNSVHFVYEGIAAYYGLKSAGIANNKTYLNCNIGAGATDISIIKGKNVIKNKSISFCSSKINQKIKEHLKTKYNLIISYETSEKIKKEINLNRSTQIEIIGKDNFTQKITKIKQSTNELSSVIEIYTKQLLDSLEQVIDSLPVNNAEDINQEGIFLTGGGSKLSGLDKFLQKKLKLKVNIVKKPSTKVIEGLKVLNSDNKLLEETRIKETILL